MRGLLGENREPLAWERVEQAAETQLPRQAVQDAVAFAEERARREAERAALEARSAEAAARKRASTAA